MFVSRLGSVTRAHRLPVIRCASSSSQSFAAGSRRLHLRYLPERVAGLQSRALHGQSSTTTKAPRNNSQVQAKQYHGSVSGILQSAFPKKTFIALVIISVALYLVPDDFGMDWADYALNSFEPGDPGINSALHFHKSKEELEQGLHHHIGGISSLLKDPSVVQLFSEQFESMAGGWRMTENDAVQENIPVTHGCRFQSNNPCEDYFALGTSFGPGSQPWNYWSIMDGHAGRHTAALLQLTLIPSLANALLNLPAHASAPEIDSTIKSTFLRIDKQLMDAARTAANWFPAANAAAIVALAPVFSGSCALLAAFDPASDTLRVACTGDSRAVLGRWDAGSQSYTTIALSEDQTGFNAKEVQRLAEAHPDEPDMIDPKTGRLLGIAVTRAFGDHRWKWDNDFIRSVQAKFWGPSPRPQSKTAPYMTAEPEITETQVVRTAKGDVGRKSDFMILASDGLWDRISSEHAVECVSRWLEARDRGQGEVKKDPQLQVPQFGSTEEDPGLTYSTETGAQIDWKATPEYFAIEDENAAICLTRNAFGGTRRALFMGMLNVPEPMTRYAVDDTTVMVVFFDKLDGVAARGGGKKKSWWKLW